MSRKLLAIILKSTFGTWTTAHLSPAIVPSLSTRTENPTFCCVRISLQHAGESRMSSARRWPMWFLLSVNTIFPCFTYSWYTSNGAHVQLNKITLTLKPREFFSHQRFWGHQVPMLQIFLECHRFWAVFARSNQHIFVSSTFEHGGWIKMPVFGHNNQNVLNSQIPMFCRWNVK